MRKLFVLFAILLNGLFFSQAQGEKIRVVTRDIKPFSFEEDGRRKGFAMELWQEVARETGLEYDVTVVGTAKEMIDALANKTADAAVGALSVTASREAVVDFSQPFYESGLQIAVAGTSASFGDIIWQLATNFFNWKLLGAFALLVVVMFIISHLVWLYEHKVNPEMWPETYHHGMWESFWWTISTLLVGGADNKGPTGVGGRIVAIVWMLLSIVLVSLLTASFSATLTVNTLKSDISGPKDLIGREVASLKGSTAETWLSSHGCNVRPFTKIDECIAALKKNEVAAIVFDAPMLQYAIKQSGDKKLQLINPIFDRQNYAIGLQQDSPLRERINQALLSLNERGINAELREEYFDSAE